MKSQLNEKTLTIYLSGEITSTNANEIENEINKVLAEQDFASLVLDLKDIRYISSAGLRIVLKLKQKYNDFCVINTSLEVYEVFEMTGFTSMMTVKKALANVSVEGCELIGEGYFSNVYRINKETIIKVFKNECDIKDVERELNLAKQAFILGIPTAISFDIVLVNNHYGVRFELLASASLRDLFRDYPDRFEELANKYANLLKTINTTKVSDTTLPDAKQSWLMKVKETKEFIPESYHLKLLKMIEGIREADTFVHGDCHIKNILSQENDLLLIDMDTLSKGHPIFELAAIYATYHAFEEDNPGNCEAFLGISTELSFRIYDEVLKIYLNSPTKEIYDKIRIVSYAHMIYWNKVNDNNNPIRLEGCRKRLLELLDQYDDLDIGI